MTTEKIKLAKLEEAYHRKQMEYYQEEVKILERTSKNKLDKARKSLKRLRKNG